MVAQAFEIDLRGKNLEEVMQGLRENGFLVSKTDVPLWDNDFRETLRFVWVMEKEAHLLTVITSAGEKKMLWPGENLYFIDQPEDIRTVEYGWAVIAPGAIP